MTTAKATVIAETAATVAEDALVVVGVAVVPGAAVVTEVGAGVGVGVAAQRTAGALLGATKLDSYLDIQQ